MDEMMSSVTCTVTGCSQEFLYQPPALAGNAVLLALFTILVPVALLLGAKYKSPGLSIVIVMGLSLEVMGYIGRLLLHSKPEDDSGEFTIFLVGTTLGSTCICGALFLTVPGIVAIFGEEYHSWRSAWYLLLLFTLAIVSFILEIAGSVVSTAQVSPITVGTGVRVLIAGLAVQLAALAIFVIHFILFAICLRTKERHTDPVYTQIYTSSRFKRFMVAFAVATILVILRTAYRIVQLAEGFLSVIAQAETLFLVFDGTAMLIATTLILVYYPARVLGQPWPEISFHGMLGKPSRPTHPAPTQPRMSRPSPVDDQLSMKSHMSISSPRRTNQSGPLSQRDMVNSENLW